MSVLSVPWSCKLQAGEEARQRALVLGVGSALGGVSAAAEAQAEGRGAGQGEIDRGQHAPRHLSCQEVHETRGPGLRSHHGTGSLET